MGAFAFEVAGAAGRLDDGRFRRDRTDDTTLRRVLVADSFDWGRVGGRLSTSQDRSGGQLPLIVSSRARQS